VAREAAKEFCSGRGEHAFLLLRIIVSSRAPTLFWAMVARGAGEERLDRKHGQTLRDFFFFFLFFSCEIRWAAEAADSGRATFRQGTPWPTSGMPIHGGERRDP